MPFVYYYAFFFFRINNIALNLVHLGVKRIKIALLIYYITNKQSVNALMMLLKANNTCIKHSKEAVLILVDD